MTVFLARWYILLPQHFGLSALIPPSSAPATKTKKSSNSKLTTMNQSRDYLGFVNLESPNSKTYRWIIMVFQDLLETGKSQIYYVFCLSESLSREYSGIVNLSSLIRNVLPKKIVPRILFILHTTCPNLQTAKFMSRICFTIWRLFWIVNLECPNSENYWWILMIFKDICTSSAPIKMQQKKKNC